MDDIHVIRNSPLEYRTDLHDCLVCIKYLNDYNLYEGQRIGIITHTIPGFSEIPKGSYVLFMENKRLGSPTDIRYIVEKPKLEEYIKDSIDNYLSYGFELGFISHKLNNVPAGLVTDAVIKFH